MTRSARTLSILLLVELVTVAGWAGLRLTRTVRRVPRPEMSFLDSITAAEILRRQQAVVAHEPDSWQQLGELYTVNGFFPEAEYCLKVATELHQQSHRSHLWLGIVRDRLGRLPAAQDSFRQALRLAPDRRRRQLASHHIGRILLRSEQPRQAEEAFLEAGAMPMARYERARLMIREGRVAEAVPLLDGLLEEFPESYQLHDWRRRAALATGDVKRVRYEGDLVERTRQPLPTDLVAEMLLAEERRYGLRKRLDQARRLSGQAVGASAIELLVSVIETGPRPEAVEGLRLLARLQFEMENFQETERHVAKLLNEESVGPLDYLLIGDAQAAQGAQRVVDAHKSWNRSLRLRPTAAAHRRLAGRGLSGAGDPVGANGHLARAEFLEGVDALRRDEIVSARAALERAVKAEPKMSAAWFYLGECDRIEQRYETARQHYRRCLQLQPTHGRAIERLDWLDDSPETVRGR